MTNSKLSTRCFVFVKTGNHPNQQMVSPIISLSLSFLSLYSKFFQKIIITKYCYLFLDNESKRYMEIISINSTENELKNKMVDSHSPIFQAASDNSVQSSQYSEQSNCIPITTRSSKIGFVSLKTCILIS
jgi:hypothetical protein